MPHITPTDILQILAILIGTAVFILVVRSRHRNKAAHDAEYSAENVCDHLRPAFDLLRSRGHAVHRVGQVNPELPLEIHLRPPFDPQAVYDELQLQPPVYVSERNVLFCKEDWCELHPVK